MSDAATPAALKDPSLAVALVCGFLLLIHVPWRSDWQSLGCHRGSHPSQQKVKKQGLEIEQLRFLIANYLSDWELQHLKKLVNGSMFKENLYLISDQFEGEIRHLRTWSLLNIERITMETLQSKNSSQKGRVSKT